MEQIKFEKLKDSYDIDLQNLSLIQQENEKQKYEAKNKLQSGFVSTKFFFVIRYKKFILKYKHKRYLMSIERKKRFTLTMAGESLTKKILVKTLQGIFLAIIAIATIFPFYWMLMTSFKPFSDVDPTMKETIWPKTWSLEAYRTLFDYVDSDGSGQTISIGTFFGNSIYIALISTVAQMFVSLLGGFALYNWKTKFNGIFMIIMFSLIMVPGEAMLLGRYIFAISLGWKDSVLALIVPFIGNVYTVYLMSNAFNDLGKDMKQACKIDGLSTFKYFYKIALPAVKATIITSAIISFIEGWNSTLWPVMIMKDGSSHATIPMLLYGLINITGGDISKDLQGLQNPLNFKMAASVISILPILVVFIVFNKPIIRGISNRKSANSTKG